MVISEAAAVVPVRIRWRIVDIERERARNRRRVVRAATSVEIFLKL